MKIDYYLKRFVAALFDVVIIAIIMFIYTRVDSGSYDLEEKTVPTLIFLPVFYLYFVLQESIFKTTLGKRIFSLEVKSEKNINPIHIVVRNIFNFIELVIPFIYLLSILISGLSGSKKPRKIGDILSGCYIGYRDETL